MTEPAVDKASHEFDVVTQAYEDEVSSLRAEVRILEDEVQRLTNLINTPHTNDFLEAVRIEIAHQKESGTAAHDSMKSQADWYWLLGYLGGKALHSALAENIEKAKHHTITVAAMCAQWHENLKG